MDPRARIIDASANRAREAVRVLEDAARFALDDAELTESLKSLRHGLTAAIGALPIDRRALLSARDTPGDVGTAISNETERSRSSHASVVAAAGGRLAESLRSLEETAKTIGSGGEAFEALRYRSYSLAAEIEQRLLRIPPQVPLCVLITESLCPDGDWERVAESAIAGGAGVLQLREKELGGGELVSRARGLIEIAGGRARVIVNDRADVALAAGADGVHLGQTDLPIADARRVAGEGFTIGVSCATLEHAVRAAEAGADYIGLGPMFASTTKPKDTLAGPALIEAVLADGRTRDLPHFAISGIDAAGARELGSVGCRGVAVSSAVCSAEDPEAAAAGIIEALAAGARLAPCQSPSSSAPSTTA